MICPVEKFGTWCDPLSLAIVFGVWFLFSVSGIGGDSCSTNDFQFVADQTLAPSAAEVEIPSGLPAMIELNMFCEGAGFDSSAILASATLVWGDEQAKSVALVVIEDDGPALYVDSNRDHQLTPVERIAPNKNEPNIWLFELDAWFIGTDETDIRKVPQQLLVRWNPRDRKITARTAGRMVGTVEFRGDQLLAAYEDRNANGRWFDPEDRLFIDLDQNGELDRITERFPCVGMKRHGNELFAIRGDKTGQTLNIVPVTDRGTVAPKISLLDTDVEVEWMEATLTSETGFQFRFEKLGHVLEVPVGDYRVQQVRLKLRDFTGQYFFAFNRLPIHSAGFRVAADELVDIELLGDLKITATVANTTVSNEQRKVITPMLRTSTGLYLTNSAHGQREAAMENRMQARSVVGLQIIGLGSTGFS